jgi:hypothetical protein
VGGLAVARGTTTKERFAELVGSTRSQTSSSRARSATRALSASKKQASSRSTATLTIARDGEDPADEAPRSCAATS